MMKLALKLRLLRHSAGLDQHQVAAILQISVAEYSRIETGLVKPEEGTFEKLAEAFGSDMA